MKRILAIGCILTIIFFSGLACAKKAGVPKAGSATAESMLTLLPKDIKGVVMVDLHRALNTEVSEKILKENKNYQKYQEFVQKTGLDPKKDLYFLAIGITGEPKPEMGRPEAEGVAVLNLKYTKDTILAMIKAQGQAPTEETYGGLTLYHFPEEGKKPDTGVFLDESNLAIGNADIIKSVVDVYQKKSESAVKNADLMSVIKTTNKDALVWMALNFTADMTKELTSQNPMLGSLEGLKSLTLFFDYKNNAISAEIKALNADEAKNKQIADLLNGLKSFGGAASAKNPAIGELLGNIEVSSAADHVKISANIPEELLTKLREAASKKAAEKTEGAEPEED